MPARTRSSSDLQHGSSSKGESAEDLRDAQQQVAEATKELQRLREDRDQLRVALASALSQTQQLGALQSEVSMLKGQLEETRQMTMHSMVRNQSAVSLPYDQVMIALCQSCPPVMQPAPVHVPAATILPSKTNNCPSKEHDEAQLYGPAIIASWSADP